METGRVCVNAAVPTDSCEAESAKSLKCALAYPESAGFGTEMAGCDVASARENQAGEAVTVDNAAEFSKVGVGRTSVRE